MYINSHFSSAVEQYNISFIAHPALILLYMHGDLVKDELLVLYQSVLCVVSGPSVLQCVQECFDRNLMAEGGECVMQASSTGVASCGSTVPCSV